MHDNRATELTRFTAWVEEHIKGYEKGEAHIFLDRLFKAFEHEGIKEAGAELELRVKKHDMRGTAFADLVWKPIVLIEMKKRGEDLARHYRQAFDYWVHLVPGRPRYVILCNFDEFWVYDFETQMDSPVDRVHISELQDRYGPLKFLYGLGEKPSFGNHHEKVTREAADCLALCFNRLINRKVDRALAQKFILQMLVALFAEDIGLLQQYTVASVLDECDTPSKSYDLIGGLFTEMNSPGTTKAGRFKGVNYFNGGLFAKPSKLELEKQEVHLLKEAVKYNWAQVRPEIFGTLFEHSLEKKERHAYGAHFTSADDIMKIIRPTISDPWKEQIGKARSLKQLHTLLNRLHRFKVLDPACGSGNFLYLAYRELKRIEAVIIERINEKSKSGVRKQRRFGFVTADNFFGIDVNPFAVELAKVTMMIGRKLAIDELHITESALPLDNLDRNFLASDALLDTTHTRTAWPRVDVIIGNPPFLGAKRLKPERGAEYINRLRTLYPEIPGMADYCVYWFRRAHDHLPECTALDPVAGRAGLVGTQNIRSNQSRVGGLDFIVKTGTIVEAVDNQPWSGESEVHVSIANWIKTRDVQLSPRVKHLWFALQPKADPKTARLRRRVPAHKQFDLDYLNVKDINSSLSAGIDVSSKRVLLCNKKPKRCFQGKIPGYEGFLLDARTTRKISSESAEIVVPYLTGRELLGDPKIVRWAIDFRDMDIVQASRFSSAFQHCERHVLPAVKRKHEQAEEEGSDMASARKEHLRRWWQFWNRRDELNKALNKLPRYIGCSRVTRRPIMLFLSSKICPSDLIQVFAFDDDYSFGILQSSAHFEWFRKSSRLKIEKDVRYSVRGVFETYPWPQSPGVKQMDAVVRASRELRRIRNEALRQTRGGFREVYRILELPGKHPLKHAHADLNRTVLDAYGFSQRDDLLAQILALNHEVADRIEEGQLVTHPGIPPNYPSPSRTISTDCLHADVH